MGSSDCDCTPKVNENTTKELRRALAFVVFLNGAMAVAGLGASLLGESQAIQADGLDFLGDSVATGVSLALVGRAAQIRASVAWWQGLALGALGVAVLLGAIVRMTVGHTPEAEVMSVYGIIGFAVNISCAFILLKHRGGDSSVHAAWLYSRNDALGNIAVLVAAGAIWILGSRWPDLVVAGILATLFIHSATGIMQKANSELKSHKQGAKLA